MSKKVKFVTMSGVRIDIASWTLSKEEVTKAATQYFGEPVVCAPVFFGSGTVCLGWRCISIARERVVGYLPLSVGKFGDYPDDYAEYGINVEIPLGETWAMVMGASVRFLHDEIQIKF